MKRAMKITEIELTRIMDKVIMETMPEEIKPNILSNLEVGDLGSASREEEDPREGRGDI